MRERISYIWDFFFKSSLLYTLEEGRILLSAMKLTEVTATEGMKFKKRFRLSLFSSRQSPLKTLKWASGFFFVANNAALYTCCRLELRTEAVWRQIGFQVEVVMRELMCRRVKLIYSAWKEKRPQIKWISTFLCWEVDQYHSQSNSRRLS